MPDCTVHWFKIASAVLLISLSATPHVHSQPNDNLHFSVDRPGISDYPTIIPTGNLQIESGLEYFQREDHRYILLPTVMLRTAVSRKLEFRLTNRFIRVDSVQIKDDNRYFYNVALDFKYLLFLEKGIIPATTLLAGYTYTPPTSEKLRRPIWGDYIMLLMENNLHDKVLFNYNVGLVWNGYDSRMAAMYSLCIEVELSTQAAVFVEQSTFFHTGEKNDNWVVLGYTHLVARHSQVDFSAAVDFNKAHRDYFYAVGFSTRLPFSRTP